MKKTMKIAALASAIPLLLAGIYALPQQNSHPDLEKMPVPLRAVSDAAGEAEIPDGTSQVWYSEAVSEEYIGDSTLEARYAVAIHRDRG